MKISSAVSSAFVLALTVNAASGETVTNWLQISNYPAHISAINFNGPLSQTQGLVWGSWSVRFTSQTAIATWEKPVPAAASQISVSGLTCSNDIAGQSSCGMSFADDPMNPEGNGTYCFLGVNSSTPLPPIQISCPTSIDFSR